MTTLPDRIDQILNGLDLGYKIRMERDATNQWESAQFKKKGLAELEAARTQILAIVDEAKAEGYKKGYLDAGIGLTPPQGGDATPDHQEREG